MTAAELLQRAKVAFLENRANYRDSLLSVGWLLHDFILARIREGDGLSEEKRCKGHFTRMWAIRDAGRELRLRCDKVNSLISSAMAVDLLWGRDKPLGSLRHRALHFLAIFIDRKVDRSGKSHKPPGYDFALTEQWEIRQGFEKTARELFRRAVEEDWTVLRLRKAVEGVERKPKGRRQAEKSTERRQASPICRPPASKPTRSPRKVSHARDMPPLADMAAAGTPADVAEMCLELIQASQDPQAVAERLLPEVQRLKNTPKKRRPLAV